MADTDYDTRRVRADTEPDLLDLARFTGQRAAVASGRVDLEVDDGEPPTLPDVMDRDQFPGDEMGMPVMAQRPDEFTCGRCFLVLHQSRQTRAGNGALVCRDCS